MVTAILKAGTPVEFTLTGIAGTVTAIQNDRVLIQNSKGETVSPSLADVLVMVKSGALKMRSLLWRVPGGYIRGPAGTTTNLLLRLGLIKGRRRGQFGLIETGSH